MNNRGCTSFEGSIISTYFGSPRSHEETVVEDYYVMPREEWREKYGVNEEIKVI